MKIKLPLWIPQPIMLTKNRYFTHLNLYRFDFLKSYVNHLPLLLYTQFLRDLFTTKKNFLCSFLWLYFIEIRAWFHTVAASWYSCGCYYSNGQTQILEVKHLKKIHKLDLWFSSYPPKFKDHLKHFFFHYEMKQIAF